MRDEGYLVWDEHWDILVVPQIDLDIAGITLILDAGYTFLDCDHEWVVYHRFYDSPREAFPRLDPLPQGASRLSHAQPPPQGQAGQEKKPASVAKRG